METIMTDEQVLQIFADHGFPDDHPTMTNVGFRNQVYIGDHAVLKVYPEDNVRGYQQERWFYETAKPDFAPKLYAAGKSWILMERIHGIGLFRYWRDCSDIERRDLVRQISDIALAVNEVDLTGTTDFLSYRKDYAAFLKNETERLAARLLELHGIDDDLLSHVINYINTYIDLFDDSRFYLVYNDLHFDNLLVTEDKKVILLDFEMLAIAPKDLVLDVWQRMLIHPFTYANEEDHPQTHPKDYQKLLVWMEEFAPELFSHPEVRRRVNIYGMLYEMDLLCDYPMAKWPTERLEKYLCENLW